MYNTNVEHIQYKKKLYDTYINHSLDINICSIPMTIKEYIFELQNTNKTVYKTNKNIKYCNI